MASKDDVFSVDIAFPCHFIAFHHLHSYKSVYSIGYASKYRIAGFYHEH